MSFYKQLYQLREVNEFTEYGIDWAKTHSQMQIVDIVTNVASETTDIAVVSVDLKSADGKVDIAEIDVSADVDEQLQTRS